MIATNETAWIDPAPSFEMLALPYGKRFQIFPVRLKADGLDYLEIPVSSITIRMRHVSPTYVRVTVPNPVDWTSQILARAGGQLHIFAGYEDSLGVRWVKEMIYANIQDVTLSDHLNLQISGTRYITQKDPQTVEISNPIWIRKCRGGKREVRAAFDFERKPTDTVILPNGDSFTADLITFVVGGFDAHMTIEGAANG